MKKKLFIIYLKEDNDMTKDVIYMVNYVDDNKVKHITFVKGFSAVRFLENRFNTVSFEKTDTFIRDTSHEDNYRFS